MESLDVAALCFASFAFVGVLLVRVRRRSCTACNANHSDEVVSGPNAVADHNEQDSLLPKFAGLLLSPWRSVTTEQNDESKMVHSVQKKPRSMSLPMPLSIGKKKKAADVPIKKVHVPYFFPLLNETAEWWQMHQATFYDSQLTPEQDAGAGLKDDLSSSEREQET